MRNVIIFVIVFTQVIFTMLYGRSLLQSFLSVQRQLTFWGLRSPTSHLIVLLYLACKFDPWLDRRPVVISASYLIIQDRVASWPRGRVVSLSTRQDTEMKGRNLNVYTPLELRGVQTLLISYATRLGRFSYRGCHLISQVRKLLPMMQLFLLENTMLSFERYK